MDVLSWTLCSCSNWCGSLPANALQFHQIKPFCTTNKVIHWSLVVWSTSKGSTEIVAILFRGFILEAISVWAKQLILIELKTLAGTGKKSYKISLWSRVLEYTSINIMHGISRDSTENFWQIVTFWTLFFNGMSMMVRMALSDIERHINWGRFSFKNPAPPNEFKWFLDIDKKINSIVSLAAFQ